MLLAEDFHSKDSDASDDSKKFLSKKLSLINVDNSKAFDKTKNIIAIKKV